jgi:hypothetical protein
MRKSRWKARGWWDKQELGHGSLGEICATDEAQVGSGDGRMEDEVSEV